MAETSTEGLLALLEEILALEKEAEALYNGYLQTIEDESIARRLARIRDDEVGHVQIASDLITLIRYEEYPRIREGFKGFTAGSATLVSCTVDRYVKANSAVLRHLVNERGFRCIYVAVNKPSTTLTNVFAKEGIDVEKVSFIDCTTLDLGDEKKIVVRPDNPTDLSMAIDGLARKIPGNKFVHFDTISTCYIFHPSNLVERFALSQVHSLEAQRVGLVLVAVKEEIDDKALARLTTFCDNKVEL
ncbi:MAG: hypothetical protein ACE5Z5_06665 [Candidatus Bathyarchaeia archaeon]